MSKKYLFLGITPFIVICLILIVNTKLPEDKVQVTLNKEETNNMLSYTLNGIPTDMTYRELIDTKVVKGITCKNGTIAAWDESTKTVNLSNVQVPDYCTIDFGYKKLYTQLLIDNPTILTRTSFDSVLETDNIGTLYKATGNETEDGSDVYYFAGNALNNWVKFGRDQDGSDLYWRIIRTNEDGGIRLLYIGPDTRTESAYISIGAYNSTYDNTMYVGYMYGETGSLDANRLNTTSSPIKTKTDEWYSRTINVKTDVNENTYDKYVSRTAIYCNDRSGNGYLVSGDMYYAANNRLYSNKTPSYRCGNKPDRSLYSDSSITDKFSVSTSKGGNGKLQYPIAQITADELVYAGGRYTYNAKTWYYYNSVGGSAVGSGTWWTMTPYRQMTSYSHMFVIYNYSDMAGNFWGGHVANDFYIRPVLSLKSCVQVSGGNGSSDKPYEVTIDNACATSEN